MIEQLTAMLNFDRMIAKYIKPSYFAIGSDKNLQGGGGN